MSDQSNAFALLDAFDFWKVQTIHSNGRRRYECEVRKQVPGRSHRKVAKATARTKEEAIRNAIAKLPGGDDKGRPHGGGAPWLRLTQ